MIETRALRERDNRAAFRSGDADLDRFFQQFAGQNQFRHHLGVTYVAVDDQCLSVEAVEGGSDARPAPTPMFLPVRAIRDAMGGRP